MITKNNDTIFGQVSRSIFNKYKIIDKTGKKTQFGTKKDKKFRKDGVKFFNKKKIQFFIELIIIYIKYIFRQSHN